MREISIQSFVSSWESSNGDTFSDRMARRSLEALAHEVPSLGEVLRDLKAPVLETLDLHLNGPLVHQHSTSAFGLSELYGAIAEATKEIVKSITGATRSGFKLNALAPSPGSVRIVLQAPYEKYIQTTIGDNFEESPHGQALRSVAQLLLMAEQKESALEASAHALPRKARTALSRAGNAIRANKWEIEGELVARGKEQIKLSISPDGAGRLVDAVNEVAPKTYQKTIMGDVDGWAWSTGTLRFLPKVGRGFSAAVPPQLQPVVARLNGIKAEGATMRFTVSEKIPVGSTRPSRTSYLLADILNDGNSGVSREESGLD